MEPPVTSSCEFYAEGWVRSKEMAAIGKVKSLRSQRTLAENAEKIRANEKRSAHYRR
jgi:hypothetical protein